MHRAVMAAFSLLIPLSMGSVPYRCQQGAFDGVSLFSVDLESQDDVAGCQTHCDAVPACISLAVEGTTCEVFGKNAVMKAEVNSTACTKAPQLSFACTEGAVYAESPLFSLADVPSLEACQQECSNFVGTCNAISMHGDGVCDILAAPSLTVPAPNASACAVAQPAFTCTSDAGLSEGTLLSLLADIASVEDCQAQCQHSQDCAAVQYTHATSTCELKANDARQEPRAGSTACIRSTTAPRAGGPGEVAYVGFEMGLHIAGLTPQVFDTLDTPVNTSEQTSVLRVATHVKVPVGIAPELFELTVHNTVAGELAKPDNTFARKLDPVLRTLGLHPLGNSPRSLGGVWSLAAASTLWKPQASEILTLSLVFEFSSSVDVETDGGRRALAALLAFEVGLPVSSVSFEEVLWCADRFGYVDCERKWAAAAPPAGQGREGQVLGAPDQKKLQSKKVVTTFEVPANGTAAEFCHNATQALPCDKNTSSVLVQQYGLRLCGQCDEDEGSAPVDDTYNTLTSAATSRRLLEARDAKTLGCVQGYMPVEYGLVSAAFAVEGMEPLDGTLQECIDACTVDKGCYAFIRDTTRRPEDTARCEFRSTILDGQKGDKPQYDDMGTYRVNCASPETCMWHFLDHMDLREHGEQYTTAQTTSATKCSEMCQQTPNCNGITFDRSTGECHFVRSLVGSQEASRNEEGFFSAICHREKPDSPCFSGACGSEAACIPLLNQDYRCRCADGFTCTSGCDGLKTTRTCEWSSSLRTLFQEAMELLLNVDEHGLDVQAESIGVKQGTADREVKVTTQTVQLEATHIVSLTFDNTTPDVLLSDMPGKSHTVLEEIRLNIATEFGISPLKVSVSHMCQITTTGAAIGCVDENNAPTTIESLRPKVKDYVSRNYQGAIDWCASADPTVVAEPKSQSEVQQLVFRASGDMLETRSYWVGATCDESCSNADNWSWQNAPGVQVDWTELKHRDAELKDDLACAVLRWDSQNVEWRLVPVSCESGDYYPVCTVTHASDPHADACEADGSCDLKVSFEVELERERDVAFVTVDDKTWKYHPVDSLPAGLTVVDDQGQKIGVVDSNGKTGAITYPPVDSTVNTVVKNNMGGFTNINEAVEKVAADSVERWVSGTGLASANGVCHEGLEMLHVQCADDMKCSLVEPMMVQRTSCHGTPPCLNTECNGNGYAQGFVGQCSCRCKPGFDGDNCDKCASGFKDYPKCVVEDGPVETLYHVMFLKLEQNMNSVQSQYDVLVSDLQIAMGHFGTVSVRYICPIDACPGTDCVTPVNTWPSQNRQQCFNSDDLSSRRYAANLGVERTVVEVLMSYNDVFSTKGLLVGKELLDAMVMYENQKTGTFSQFGLAKTLSVYGPTTALDGLDVAPQAPDSLPSGGVRGIGTFAGTSEEETNWIIVGMVAGGMLLFCLCLFAFFFYRRNKRKKAGTKELIERVSSETKKEEDTATVIKTIEEPMGIMWDDHTLMVGVVPGSPAERAGLDRFRSRRVARVNGMKVSTLRDIREAVEGQSVVTLEFEPRFSAIVVRVAGSVESFDETEFLSIFADRIADALHLVDFHYTDIDLQSVFDRPDKGELLLTLKLHGLTSDQVTTVVALCVTPGEAIRSGLPIIGAFLANSKGRPAVAPVWFSCQWLPEAAAGAGCYLQVPERFENGFPVWQHVPADHWLYATPEGYWAVVNDESLIGFECADDEYILKSCDQHGGAEPYEVLLWRTPLREDPNVLATPDEPRAHDFVIGQKVVFPSEIELADKCVVAAKTEALVMGEDGHLVTLCLMNEGSDVVTVSPEVVDSPDGPRIEVFHEGKWQAATIVKVKGGMVKVRFDCPLCADRWVDKDEDRAVLRCMPSSEWSVGDIVILAPGVFDQDAVEGCLRDGEEGTVVACGDVGQARPYLVQGPSSLTWYASSHLAFAPSAAAAAHEQQPFGDVEQGAMVAHTTRSATSTGSHLPLGESASPFGEQGTDL